MGPMSTRTPKKSVINPGTRKRAPAITRNSLSTTSERGSMLPFIEARPPFKREIPSPRRSLRPTKPVTKISLITHKGLVVAANSSKTYSSKKGKSKKNKSGKIFPLVQLSGCFGVYLTKNQEKSEALAVYHVISQIPRGRVASYGDIAKMAGLPGYARYVGYLLKSVPTDTSLPWHRVVRSDGTIPQETIAKQKPKLMAEKVVLKGQKVSQALFWNPGD
tara:strand:- start:68 stop:724 length:657 start_codon:yes stop_codon:yes gene_type:complete